MNFALKLMNLMQAVFLKEVVQMMNTKKYKGNETITGKSGVRMIVLDVSLLTQNSSFVTRNSSF